MKKFAEFIAESHSHTQVGGLESQHVPHDIKDPEVVARINAILGHTAVSEYMNPSAAIGQIDSKLGQLGLALETYPEITETGEYEVSMKRYGDQFGKSVDTPHDEFDEKVEVVQLKLKVEKLESGSFKVYGSI
ncbi:MAG: hypothetical protein CMO54_00060 [Verrucomicrobiales bacterium]|nr:hypothetical protein [Verrucomicrobiales bacterium]|tara:strand:- start:64 stop:462 length:399 start_codon:yes stop_codon:yes gene_type:complete